MQNKCPLFKGIVESSTDMATPPHAKTTPQTTPTTEIGHGDFERLGKKREDVCFMSR